jgi:hypothetical protein
MIDCKKYKAKSGINTLALIIFYIVYFMFYVDNISLGLLFCQFIVLVMSIASIFIIGELIKKHEEKRNMSYNNFIITFIIRFPQNVFIVLAAFYLYYSTTDIANITFAWLAVVSLLLYILLWLTRVNDVLIKLLPK